MGQCLSRSRTEPHDDNHDNHTDLPKSTLQQRMAMATRSRVWSVSSMSHTPSFRSTERETTLTTTATTTANTRTISSTAPEVSSFYFEKTIDGATCSCEDLLFTADLNFVALPSLWTSEHDDVLHEVLCDLRLQDLFDVFRQLLIENTVHHDDPTILFSKKRSKFPLSSFCECWYKNFSNENFRIMQLGTCGGRTRFALNFAGSQLGVSLNGNDRRFRQTIELGDQKIPVEILDSSIGEFPSMTRAYLQSFDPHVLVFMFDVCDIDSWISLQRTHQRLVQVYESCDEAFGGTDTTGAHSRHDSVSRGSPLFASTTAHRRESTTMTLSHDLPRHSFGAPPQLHTPDKSRSANSRIGAWSISGILGISNALYVQQYQGSTQSGSHNSRFAESSSQRESSVPHPQDKNENIYHSSSMSTRIFSQMPPIILVGLHNHRNIRSDASFSASSFSSFSLRSRSSTCGSAENGQTITRVPNGSRSRSVRSVLEKHLQMLKQVHANKEVSAELSSLNDLYGGPDVSVVDDDGKVMEEKLEELPYGESLPRTQSASEAPLADPIDLVHQPSITVTATELPVIVDNEEVEPDPQAMITRKETLKTRRKRMKKIREPRFRRIISTRQGYRLAEKWDCVYIEASTVNDTNVVDCIRECVRERFVHDTFSVVRPRSHGVV